MYVVASQLVAEIIDLPRAQISFSSLNHVGLFINNIDFQKIHLFSCEFYNLLNPFLCHEKSFFFPNITTFAFAFQTMYAAYAAAFVIIKRHGDCMFNFGTGFCHAVYLTIIPY